MRKEAQVKTLEQEMQAKLLEFEQLKLEYENERDLDIGNIYPTLKSVEFHRCVEEEKSFEEHDSISNGDSSEEVEEQETEESEINVTHFRCFRPKEDRLQT